MLLHFLTVLAMQFPVEAVVGQSGGVGTLAFDPSRCARAVWQRQHAPVVHRHRVVNVLFVSARRTQRTIRGLHLARGLRPALGPLEVLEPLAPLALGVRVGVRVN